MYLEEQKTIVASILLVGMFQETNTHMIMNDVQEMIRREAGVSAQKTTIKCDRKGGMKPNVEEGKRKGR